MLVTSTAFWTACAGKTPGATTTVLVVTPPCALIDAPTAEGVTAAGPGWVAYQVALHAWRAYVRTACRLEGKPRWGEDPRPVEAAP